MIELIDIIDDNDSTLHTEEILKESLKMIGQNIFRTFKNRNRKTQHTDPDEEETYLDESWPHLQLSYELLLKFMMSIHLENDIVAENIS